MLKIKYKNKRDGETEVYINKNLYPKIIAYPDSGFLFCHNTTDFLFLSEYSFSELIQNKIQSIGHSQYHGNGATFYFSYSINTTYEDIDYEEEGISIFEETDEMPFPIIKRGNYISASLNFKYGEWKKLYSITEFQSYVHLQVLANDFLAKNAIIYFEEGATYNEIELLTIEYRFLDNHLNMSEYFRTALPIFYDILEKAQRELDNQHSLDIYSTYFRFPEEYKVSCKQYLMYFAQFLLDLGISVDTELKDTSKGTFFSIIPKNKDEALQGIKELLIEYLNAPNYFDEGSSLLSNSDLALTQFQANLFHLKSQLAFANAQIELKEAIIQTKQATIQSLNLTNYQLSEEIRSQAKNDEESIIPGVISVTKLDKAGFRINFPELLRRLKRKI